MTQATRLEVTASDGHRFALLHVPARGTAQQQVLWLPALGVAARHYLPLAQALALRGCSVVLLDWRGHGSSSLRAGRGQDWGYAELLQLDLPAALATAAAHGIVVDTLGGHSLGGQLAACSAGGINGLRRLWLVASGSPYWRSFPAPRGWLLPLAYTALPAIAGAVGHLPGHRLGFGGREARGLIADWARVGRSGHYRIPAGVEQAMAGYTGQVHALSLADDWLAPPSSLQALLAKLPAASAQCDTLSATTLGTAANHFAWMRQPEAVANALVKKFL